MSLEIPEIQTKNTNSIIPNSPFKKSVFALKSEIAKFDDPLTGFAIMFAKIDSDYAKEIGIH